MPQSRRRITPRTTLDGLKKEAKRWLKALRAHDAAARARLVRALADAPAEPTLRQVQHALAREHDLAGWAALRAAVETMRSRTSTDAERAALQTLLRAAARGDLAGVAAVLDAHTPLASVRGMLHEHTGLRTALHFAVGGSHEQIVKYLLERGADPNVRDEGDNALPLHFAAEKGHMGIIRLLVEHGSDTVGAGDGHELEVIGWATVFGSANPDVVDYLLAHGARHNISSAVTVGDVEAIRALVAGDRSLLEHVMDRANRHRFPLHLAVAKRQPAALAALLELGANAESRDTAELTPLDQAALGGEVDLARRLVAHGARVELPAAVGLGLADDIARLVRAEPDALAPGGRWGTLIVRAAEHGSAATIDALVRAGAAVNVEDDELTSIDGTRGYSALHAAAWHGNVAAARALLAHGASVTTRETNYGSTPVGWAAYAGKRDVLDVLLDAPIDIFDAIEHDRLDRVRAIIGADRAASSRPFSALLRPDPPPPRFEHGAKPWWTPLSFAAALGKRDAVHLLRALDPNDHAPLVARFLDNACPDHHVRGGPDHARARSTAVRLLERHPEIAYASFDTAVVCGDVTGVRHMLAEQPTLADQRDGAANERRAGGGGNGDLYRNIELGAKGWTPLLYLCFTRLSLSASNGNAVEIARALLDLGADPNAFFMAGGSRYTPLVGVIGEGEEDRAAHPRRDELVRLLLDRGAEPYDIQVVYNIHFHGDVFWFLELMYEHAVRLGRQANWDDPEWRMLDMGGYGSGARWHLGIAVSKGDVALAEWCLAHGANPNAAPPREARLPQRSLYDEAVRRGQTEIAELLVRHGAARAVDPLSDVEAFTAACLRLDDHHASALVAAHPELLRAPQPLHEAAKRNRADVVELLLDLGVSPDVENDRKERALHHAAYAGALSVASLLIERGAEIDPVESNWGNTPLAAAVYAQHAEMIDLLARDSRDVWELTYAGKIDRLREVLQAEPERARVVAGGHTPLMWLPPDEVLAAAAAELLLAHGADPTVRNKDGMTAVDRVEALGMFELADRLHREIRRTPPGDHDRKLPG